MAERRALCPICGRPTEPSTRPFCSRRCAEVDLARWFCGDYAVPGDAEPEEEPGADAPGRRSDGGAPGPRAAAPDEGGDEP